MKETIGNLWELPCDLRVITTNPIVNRRGAAVMGRGCAREATERIGGIEYHFAALLQAHGNRVMRLAEQGSDGSWALGRFSKDRSGTVLCSFPVKRHWKEEAVPELIERSARQLVALAHTFRYETVILPRPGVGNGRLRWEDVRPILDGILDHRFTVVTFPPR